MAETRREPKRMQNLSEHGTMKKRMISGCKGPQMGAQEYHRAKRNLWLC